MSGRPCECGCGEFVYGLRVSGKDRGSPRRFITHHNLRAKGQPLSAETREKIAAAQRRAWDTRRQRIPLGTTKPSPKGYVLVKVGHGTKDWKGEHVVVMERHIGRPLVGNEHVHHINAVPTDNRIDNLVLFESSSAHTTAHWSMNRLLAGLLEDGIIGYDRDTNRYFRR